MVAQKPNAPTGIAVTRHNVNRDEFVFVKLRVLDEVRGQDSWSVPADLAGIRDLKIE
jgi:hypothetical protein